MHQQSPQSFADLTCACNALRKASRAVTRLYEETMEGAPLSLTQFAVLRNIQRHQPVPLARLADLMVMDRTTLYRALGPLEREGWIALDDGDGRSKVTRLTPAGTQAIAQSTDAWQAAQERLIGRFGLERWRSLEQTLGDLMTLAQERAA